MDLLLFAKALCFSSRNRFNQLGESKAQNEIRSKGERGEVVLPLVFAILSGSLLFGSLFWLNKYYEKKTTEHLSDFTKSWKRLEERYKD